MYRPYLKMVLRVPATGRFVGCFAWPDSGADHCTFPLSFARPLGLDPGQMPMQTTGGVGNTANVTYYQTVEVHIGFTGLPPITFTTYAGFTPGMDAQGIGLLGQTGFFEACEVRFNHKGRIFHIEV